MTQPVLTHDRLQAIMTQVAARRSRQCWRNFAGVLGVLYIALAAGLATVALCDPSHIVTNFAHLVTVILGITLVLAFPLLLPHFLVIDLRGRLMFSLIQTALETGTPPAELLRAHATVRQPGMRDRLNQIASSLESGNSLTVTLSQHPVLVRYDVCGIIELGSDEKQLIRTLEELPNDTNNPATQGIIDPSYPVAQCFFAIGIVVFLMMWIVPKYTAIFADFEITLPPLTRAIIACADYLILYWFMFVPVFCGLFFMMAFGMVLQNDKMTSWSRWPVLRRLFRNIDGARFLRVFGAGLKNQVPIPDCIAVYQRVVNNRCLKKTAQRINETVMSGGDWIEAFRKSGMVTAGESRLLESARRAGNLAAVVDQIANGKARKHARTSELVNKLVSIPCVLLIGTMIGLVVVGMFLPIIELLRALA